VGTRIVVNKGDQDPDHLAEFKIGSGLKKSEKYVFPGFLRKVAISLPKGNSFTNKQLSDSLSNALMYMKSKGDDD